MNNSFASKIVLDTAGAGRAEPGGEERADSGAGRSQRLRQEHRRPATAALL